jgi:N6-adenosine-specific RNA methylase IME4
MSGLTLHKDLELDVEKACRYLSECKDLPEIKKIRDKASAVAHYHRAQKSGQLSATKATIIAREAEARGGELLAAMDLQREHGTGRPKKGQSKETDLSPLARMGLGPAESKRMHAAASVPAAERKKIYEEAEKANAPLSANALPKIARQKKKEALATELSSKPLPQIDGRFNVIVIDPPWRYGKRAEDITHRGRNPYPDMDLAAIEALPVGARAEKNCVLWLWTTNAFMREAYTCLDAWGFEPKTILTWAKDRMGTGDWLRGKTEHCLMAVRGKPIVTLKNQTTLLEAPLREHSRKPDEFFALVESLCPGTKLEFFAREQRKGWQAWGAETEHFKGA